MARHQPAVARLVRRLCAWPSEIDDVVQEVFVRAWEKIGSFRAESALPTWLAGIAVRVCRSAHRRKLRDAAPERDLPVRMNHVSNPEGELVEIERATAVRRAVGHLSPRLREVVVLHYLEGLGPLEVAHVLRVRRGTVDMRLSRAREALRNLLGSELTDG